MSAPAIPFDDGGAAVVIASTAAAQAAQAAQEAHHAECMITMHNYQDTATTVEMRRQYADCVYAVYGDGVSPPSGVVLLVKVAIVVVLIGAATGGWRFWKDSDVRGFSRIGDTIMGIFVGAAFAAICMGALALVAAGVEYLIA